MASPSVARREIRKAVDPDDAVMMRAAEMAAWARSNARVVLTTAAVAVVLACSFLYYRIYKSQRAERAAMQYLQVQATLPNDTVQAIRQLESFASRLDGTTEAAEARLSAGQLWLGKGQPARAVDDIRPVAEGGTPVAEQAMSLLGAALTQAGKRQEAIDTYLKLADRTRLSYVKEDALTQAAILREQASDWRGAAELYRRVAENMTKGSPDRALVEMHQAEAEAHAGAAPAAAK
ncbi:tetratricopeptide repeat protein [Longimicrobium sp.]|uniref:tetratricopeptide repeat protein n=1 Tax=Longimicrobium sp. TaxID=2029185 RepID=UPI002BAD0052|nr:tetratricopeptide repeat protein [Longimicrobium sp.]HSU12706.1 tetratricopeptide repeat protein [Longimicrobium sp.]